MMRHYLGYENFSTHSEAARILLLLPLSPVFFFSRNFLPFAGEDGWKSPPVSKATHHVQVDVLSFRIKAVDRVYYFLYCSGIRWLCIESLEDLQNKKHPAQYDAIWSDRIILLFSSELLESLPSDSSELWLWFGQFRYTWAAGRVPFSEAKPWTCRTFWSTIDSAFLFWVASILLLLLYLHVAMDELALIFRVVYPIYVHVVTEMGLLNFVFTLKKKSVKPMYLHCSCKLHFIWYILSKNHLPIVFFPQLLLADITHDSSHTSSTQHSM